MRISIESASPLKTLEYIGLQHKFKNTHNNILISLLCIKHLNHLITITEYGHQVHYHFFLFLLKIYTILDQFIALAAE